MNTTLDTFAVDGQSLRWPLRWSLRWHDAFAAATNAILKNVPPSTDAHQVALWALLLPERKPAATVLMLTPRFLLTDIVEAPGVVTQGRQPSLSKRWQRLGRACVARQCWRAVVPYNGPRPDLYHRQRLW